MCLILCYIYFLVCYNFCVHHHLCYIDVYCVIFAFCVYLFAVLVWFHIAVFFLVLSWPFPHLYLNAFWQICMYDKMATYCKCCSLMFGFFIFCFDLLRNMGLSKSWHTFFIFWLLLVSAALVMVCNRRPYWKTFT